MRFPKTSRLLWALGLLAVVGGTVAWLVDRGNLRVNYPSRTQFPDRGIDISHHQGVIRWGELDREHLQFVFIKATEGGDFVDHLWTSNLDSAIAHGYQVGAYHFYRLCRDPQLQLANFWAAIGGRKLDLAPSVDLEFGGNCATSDPAQVVSLLTVFLDSLEARTGQPAILYSTREFYNTYLVGRFTDHPIWMRSLFGQPELADGHAWSFWQYANRGRLAGIDGPVDLNVRR